MRLLTLFALMLGIVCLVGCSGGVSPVASNDKDTEKVIGEVAGEPITLIRKHDPQFVGPKTGENETNFETALIQFFQDEHTVQRAYLLRVKYEDEEDEWVLLGIAGEKSEETVKSCLDILHRVSGSVIPLDIMFLNKKSEEKAKAVTSPFYNANKQTS